LIRKLFHFYCGAPSLRAVSNGDKKISVDLKAIVIPIAAEGQ
jgi:hypothetical protein